MSEKLSGQAKQVRIHEIELEIARKRLEIDNLIKELKTLSGFMAADYSWGLR